MEYLLTLQTPATLLELQRAGPEIATRFPELYGFPLPDLPKRCRSANSRPAPDADITPLATERPRLTIWTADWCGPCQTLKRDLNRESEFREWLTTRYEPNWLDVDQQAALADAHGVRELPRFELGGHIWTGYLNPDQLQQQLEAFSAAPTSPPTPLAKPSQVLPLIKPADLPPPGDSPLAPQQIAPDAAPASSNEQPPSPASVRTVVPQTSTSADNSPFTKSRTGWFQRLFAPVSLISSLLPLLGLVGGTAVTGGFGGILLSLLLNRWKRRLLQTNSPTEESWEGAGATTRLPFPRHLDEARELLRLRQSEGRVAVLDALRGMVLDDELQRLDESSDQTARAVATQLRDLIDQRIDSIAPLTTRPAV
ncbi:MAG: hypothetical protein KDA89_12105 [Planctomycetaceae bacterium]|nr:hypothetical protein [Planctomycetaceae bacterium]